MDDEQVAQGQRQYLEVLRALAEREAAEGWHLGAPSETWAEATVDDDGWKFVDDRYVPPPQFLPSTWTPYAPDGVEISVEAAVSYMAARYPVQPVQWTASDTPSYPTE